MTTMTTMTATTTEFIVEKFPPGWCQGGRHDGCINVRLSTPDNGPYRYTTGGLAYLTNSTAYVVNVYTVLLTNHRKGYGKAMMVRLIEEIRSQWPHVTRIELNSSTMGRGLYEKLGFVEDVVSTSTLSPTPGVRMTLMDQ